MFVHIKAVGEIGALVRKVRHEKGLSQEKAAALTGVGRRFFSELEGGKKESMDMGKVLQILRRFGIKMHLEVRTDIER